MVDEPGPAQVHVQEQDAEPRPHEDGQGDPEPEQGDGGVRAQGRPQLLCPAAGEERREEVEQHVEHVDEVQLLVRPEPERQVEDDDQRVGPEQPSPEEGLLVEGGGHRGGLPHGGRQVHGRLAAQPQVVGAGPRGLQGQLVDRATVRQGRGHLLGGHEGAGRLQQGLAAALVANDFIKGGVVHQGVAQGQPPVFGHQRGGSNRHEAQPDRVAGEAE